MYLVGRRDSEPVENRQVDDRHRQADESVRYNDAPQLRAVHVHFGRQSQHRYARHVAVISRRRP